MPVYFTPGQLREAVGIGQETYRHWKKAVAPLRREAGYNRCFSAGDLLATSVIKALVVDHGIRVSGLTALADGVFQECNSHSWPTLERSWVVFHFAAEHVSIQPEGSGLVLDGPTLVVPLGGLIASLRRTLLAGDGDGQAMLRFPPVAQPTNTSRLVASKA